MYLLFVEIDTLLTSMGKIIASRRRNGITVVIKINQWALYIEGSAQTAQHPVDSGHHPKFFHVYIKQK